ncbi:IclR family transcriptional regulator [Paraburkholderia caballeronis]|uniref:DNA-binding transcriptional regulator, IclR family n=1 Tax=Paraburkholderia caballeronis TaxID=416943 RepID=A0A1H7HS06_9BURK|nr:IclR family transcriptional regulator [Paraburkholderia caballeronis]PXW29415.1 IclR family transcriptional regulator [Paraburkholderia caballeronis]PXX04674.1 IclR family transcriptional regulator [Paraburkholderia caballeronis]RAK05735.1 IclR family transcriptional regulator [Paraburkholderia caballeronis]SED01308.1 transcriptional regulator, IclR family [Paraburkholderia caballeronis]SEK52312.1 DNA-binding transcriptional regulator, IclR family [Paraburkholderia caballeronis]
MPPSTRSASPRAARTAQSDSDGQWLADPHADEAADAADAPDAVDGGEEKLRSGIQSIEVGFRLLDVLTNEPRAMMLRDLAQRAGMSPAKAHRYLVSFLRLGVVAQDPLSGRYELGGFALQMGLARLARVDGVKLARIALAELRDTLDVTVGIAVWGNQGPTVVHWMESSHPAKAALKLGDVMPMLGSATGLLFAAYLPRSKTGPMIERELRDARRSLAGTTPRSADELERTLAEVREHGAARVEGMLLPTIHAFCTPVFDSTGDLALGLIALGHEGAFDIRWNGEIDTALRDCAGKLSYELGYCPASRD